MKVLIFDSGTLINLSMNGLLYILEELKKSFQGRFLVTKQVKQEIIDKPIGIPRFELGALRINALLESKVLESPSSLGVSNEVINKETKHLINIANSSVRARNRFIKIVSDAEISCLALSSELSKKGIDSIISVDERTTRILAEKPENLKRIMEKKLRGEKVNINLSNLKVFSKFRFMRSSELVYVAFKKGILKVKGKRVLEAALYATKFKGSSISFEEIDVIKKM